MTHLFLFNPILGQGNDGVSFSLAPYLLIPLFVLGILGFGVICILIALRQVRHARELLHAERLKAFECGIAWQEPDAETSEMKFMHNAFWMAFWLVAIGCGAPFYAAARFADELGSIHSGIAIAAWLCAAAASIAAVICATILMIKSRAMPKR